MTDDTTIQFTVAASPADVFDTIVDVRAWWSGDIEGPTDELGAEFTYRHQDLHRSVQRVTALEPGHLVAWHVVEGFLAFVQDNQEWTGTDITFEIKPEEDGSHVRFTHRGLAPDLECFQACSGAWQYYIGTSLRTHIVDSSEIDDAGPHPVCRRRLSSVVTEDGVGWVDRRGHPAPSIGSRLAPC